MLQATKAINQILIQQLKQQQMLHNNYTNQIRVTKKKAFNTQTQDWHSPNEIMRKQSNAWSVQQKYRLLISEAGTFLWLSREDCNGETERETISAPGQELLTKYHAAKILYELQANADRVNNTTSQ
jgi:hypothetical protein